MKTNSFPKRRNLIRSIAVLFVGGGLLIPLAGSSAQAAITTWDGSIDNAWNAAPGGDSNWTGGSGTDGILASGDSAVFTTNTGLGGANLNNNLTSGAFNLAGISFSAGGPAYVIGNGTATPNAGNPFVLTGNVTNSSTNLQTINNPFSMTAARTFTTTTGGGDLALSGNISGTGGAIVKAGAGTLTLSGAISYTGDTTVNAGTLDLNGTGTSVGSLYTLSNTIVNVNGTVGFLRTLISNTAAGTATLNVNNGGTLNLGTGGALIGQNLAGSTGVLNIKSGGTVNVTDAGTSFRVGNAVNNTAQNGILTLDAGSTLNVTGTGARILVATGSTTTGTVNLNGGTLFIAGDIRGDVPIGVVTNGNNTVNLNGGTLKAGASISTFLQGMDQMNVRNGGAVFDSNGFNITVGAAGSALKHSNIGGDNAVDGGLTKLGSGTLTLDGINTYTGATAINGGTLALTVGSTIDATSGVTLASGTFDVSAKGGGYAVNNLSGNGAVVGGLTVSTLLAIGASPGTINFDSLSLTGSTTYAYELTGGGSAADLGNITNTLNLGSAVLDLTQLGTYMPGDKFTLFAYPTGNLSGSFSGLNDLDIFNAAGGEWQINYADSSAGFNGGVGTSFVTITAVTAIPEPGTLVLGGLALLGLAGVRLRRRQLG